jgi:hypothetical protein
MGAATDRALQGQLRRQPLSRARVVWAGLVHRVQQQVRVEQHQRLPAPSSVSSASATFDTSIRRPRGAVRCWKVERCRGTRRPARASSLTAALLVAPGGLGHAERDEPLGAPLEHGCPAVAEQLGQFGVGGGLQEQGEPGPGLDIASVCGVVDECGKRFNGVLHGAGRVAGEAVPVGPVELDEALHGGAEQITAPVRVMHLPGSRSTDRPRNARKCGPR